MALNGSGVFSRLYNWATDRDASVKIRADRMDAEMDGMATALSTALYKDGQQTATANQPMGGFKHTNVADGTARNHYAAIGQLQDGEIDWIDGGGTADAITGTYAPAITAVVDGMLLGVRATAANATTTPTYSPNGLTARTIVLENGDALYAGAIAGDGHDLLLRYDSANTRWLLLNPADRMTALMTTRGDLVRRGASLPERVALGAANTVLGSDGTDAAWRTIIASLEGASTTQGVILYRGAAAWAALAVGTAGQVLKTGGAAADPAWFTLPFTESFESSEQTVTVDALLTVAHGLTAKPKIVQVSLICKTIDLGYAVGEEVPWSMVEGSGTADAGYTVSYDGTNVMVAVGASISLHGKSGGGAFNYSDITTASWKFIIRAWR